jgi:Zn-dependent peptidase ImmA (M78 family)
MKESLKIECEWWGSSNGGKDFSQVCRGAIGISLDEEWLTRLEDSWGNTVRNRLNASAYTLAAWFAGNWWRLRWEPETPNSRNDIDWRLSHSMASAGDGFCWPSILFASDGETIAIASQATRGRALGPVRYLNEVSSRITAQEFERSVDTFMTLVLSRLNSEGFGSSELAGLWAEVIKERGDPALTQWRRLEAMCGFDPGEAPASLVEMLVRDTGNLGGMALEEVAAEGRHSTAEVLDEILKLAAAKDVRGFGGGFRGSLPKLGVNREPDQGVRPWQRATKLARLARQKWGLGSEPITNDRLADLLGTSPTMFDGGARGTSPMPLALRDADDDKVDIYLNRAHPTSRRFAASRLIGDSLLDSGGGRLIPATNAKTARQQFQRAFAQEFLCPFEALKAKMPATEPDEDDIAEAAAYFDVSTRVIETTLVNKGELDRESLAWGAEWR